MTLSTNRLKLIRSFKQLTPDVCKNETDNIIKERRLKCIKYLESLDTERILENEIDKAFDIDNGKIEYEIEEDE